MICIEGGGLVEWTLDVAKNLFITGWVAVGNHNLGPNLDPKISIWKFGGGASAILICFRFRMIHYCLFRDRFNRNRHRHHSVTGVYFALAGDKMVNKHHCYYYLMPQSPNKKIIKINKNKN